MKVIGLGHRKFVGKDTASRFLVEILRKEFDTIDVIRAGFADHLKTTCRQIWPMYFQDMFYYEENPERKNTFIPALNMTVRDVWIAVGNKLREVDPMVWIRAPFERAKLVGAKYLIISDVRYPNEIGYIKSLGGILLKVENDNIPQTADVADEALEGFGDWNDVIPNHGTKKELEKACHALVTKYRASLI